MSIVDPCNDRGNDIRDSQIEGLNQRQLDQDYWRDVQRPGRGAQSSVLCTPGCAMVRYDSS